MASINRVIVVGNLTRDPELRYTQGGTAVCEMRVAINDREKDSSGAWVDRPSYLTVVAWGNHAEACATHLSKGKPVGVDGKLRWEEWTGKDGVKREAVKVTATNVEFLGSREGGGTRAPHAAETTDVDFAGATGSAVDFGQAAADEDVPF